MARGTALVAAIAVALLAVSGAGGAATQQTPKRGGTLVVALTQPEPACFNFYDERCGSGTSVIPLQAILQHVLLSPFGIGGDFAWKPSLVRGVSFTTTAPFVLTYRIRPQARWSDGVPVTARDFLFTHTMILAHGSGDLELLHAKVRSVTPVDAKTVRVVLRSRVARWRGLFGPILPSHALRGMPLGELWRGRIEDPRTGRAIGSGPFLVERWDRGRQISLVRNPRYWRRPANLDRLVVRFGVASADVAPAVRRREVHVAYAYPPGFASEVRRAGVRVVSATSTAWEHLEIRMEDGRHPLLGDKLVRRALAYGVDRAAIVRELARESGLDFRILDSTSYLPQSPYYHPNWRHYRYRPAQARRLLERAGCRRGSDAVYQCGGTRLSLRFITHVSDGSVRPRVLDLIQSQLRGVGIEVVKTFAPPAAVFGTGGIYERGAFEAALFAWVKTSPDAGSKDLLGCGGSQNWTDYCQRLVTRDLDQADRILDAGRQAQVLNRADRQIAKDVPYLPLFQHGAWSAVAPGVGGYRTYWYPLIGAERWWLER